MPRFDAMPMQPEAYIGPCRSTLILIEDVVSAGSNTSDQRVVPAFPIG